MGEFTIYGDVPPEWEEARQRGLQQQEYMKKKAETEAKAKSDAEAKAAEEARQKELATGMSYWNPKLTPQQQFASGGRLQYNPYTKSIFTTNPQSKSSMYNVPSERQSTNISPQFPVSSQLGKTAQQASESNIARAKQQLIEYKRQVQESEPGSAWTVGATGQEQSMSRENALKELSREEENINAYEEAKRRSQEPTLKASPKTTYTAGERIFYDVENVMAGKPTAEKGLATAAIAVPALGLAAGESFISAGKETILGIPHLATHPEELITSPLQYVAFDVPKRLSTGNIFEASKIVGEVGFMAVSGKVLGKVASPILGKLSTKYSIWKMSKGVSVKATMPESSFKIFTPVEEVARVSYPADVRFSVFELSDINMIKAWKGTEIISKTKPAGSTEVIPKITRESTGTVNIRTEKLADMVLEQGARKTGTGGQYGYTIGTEIIGIRGGWKSSLEPPSIAPKLIKFSAKTKEVFSKDFDIMKSDKILQRTRYGEAINLKPIEEIKPIKVITFEEGAGGQITKSIYNPTRLPLEDWVADYSKNKGSPFERLNPKGQYSPLRELRKSESTMNLIEGYRSQNLKLLQKAKPVSKTKGISVPLGTLASAEEIKPMSLRLDIETLSNVAKNNARFYDKVYGTTGQAAGASAGFGVGAISKQPTLSAQRQNLNAKSMLNIKSTSATMQKLNINTKQNIQPKINTGIRSMERAGLGISAATAIVPKQKPRLGTLQQMAPKQAQKLATRQATRMDYDLNLRLKTPVPTRTPVPPLMSSQPIGGKRYKTGKSFSLKSSKRKSWFSPVPLADLLSVTQTQAATFGISHQPKITPKITARFGRMLRTGGMRFPTAEQLRWSKGGRKPKRMKLF